jgi:Ca-activated chloride channel family protein
MKKIIQIVLTLLIAQYSFAQDAASPYLVTNVKDAQIPLLASKAEVDISGTIAHVHIQQTYHNTGKQVIEAKYVFPMSVQAAVHNMTMTIGDRTIKAKVFEKEEAEQVYRKALESGKRASKLDQHRPNVFQMNIGNILPIDTLSIDIYYTEMLIPEDGQYQFVYPGAVGPRYTGENSTGETAFKTGHTSKGTKALFDYDIKVNIEAGMMIQDISCTSHQIALHYPNAKRAEISLTADNQAPANRDFILNYNLRGKAIQTGLLLYEGEKENFFTYLVEPPQQIIANKIPPREYLFVVDVSGSMSGFPLEVSKKLMRNLLGNLKQTDVFNIQLFASSSQIFQQIAVQATTENIEKGIQFLQSTHGGGGTNLLSALKMGYSFPRKDAKSAKSIIIITDGYIGVEKETFEIIEQNLNQANVFSFGIGSSVNRYLIEGMAKVGQATSFIATNEKQAEEVATRFQQYIATPLLTQIQLQAEGFEIYDVEPKSIPDVFASRPILIHGKWKGKATGNLTLTGYQGDGSFSKTYPIEQGVLSQKNEALKYLWARKKIERLDDYKKHSAINTQQEVTDLGLKYNLATQYTSFVAVDMEVVNNSTTPKVVNQLLSLPQHVENSAVGAAAAIKGKTIFKPSFNIAISQSNLTKSEERQIKMWLKVKHKQTINQLLEKVAAVKIHYDKNAKVMRIEVLENGVWKQIENVVGRTLTLPNKIKFNKAFFIVFKK